MERSEENEDLFHSHYMVDIMLALYQDSSPQSPQEVGIIVFIVTCVKTEAQRG